MTAIADDYVTASEAARIIGVSRQRVAAMIRANQITHVRPWPRQVLIPRSALTAWMDGKRPPAIHKKAVADWIIAREGVTLIELFDLDYLRALIRMFIDEARPEWDDTSKDNWVEGMHTLLVSRPRAAR